MEGLWHLHRDDDLTEANLHDRPVGVEIELELNGQTYNCGRFATRVDARHWAADKREQLETQGWL